MASTQKLDGFIVVNSRKHLSFLPDNEKISQTITDKGLNKYFSCFLDDIKAFGLSEAGGSVVQVLAKCYRLMQKNEAQKTHFCLI